MSALPSRIAAPPSPSVASRVAPARVAARRGATPRPARAASADVAVAAPATSKAWVEAWGSVQDPSTRVAYIGDASRVALRAALVDGGLAEALETVEGEVHVRGVVRGGGNDLSSETGAHAEPVSSADVTALDVSALGLGRALLGGAQVEPAGAREAISMLERDACAVVREYCAVAGTEEAVVSVSLLRGVLCRKYHVDHVPLRVMCTYLGSGTEVLSERASLAISLANDRVGRTAGDLMKGIVGGFVDAFAKNHETTKMRKSAAECELVLMKGERWPGNAGKAIVHRSPIIDGCCGEWRLCLKVDDPAFVNRGEIRG